MEKDKSNASRTRGRRNARRKRQGSLKASEVNASDTVGMTLARDSAGIGSAVYVSKRIPHTVEEPSELNIFTFLVQKYQGTVTFDKLKTDIQAFPPGVDVDKWFKKHKKKFPMHTDGNGKTKVSVFEPKCSVCFSYNSDRGCRTTSCRFLHICKTYVAGFCRFGSRCKFAHDFRGKDTRHNLKQMKLHSFSDEEILTITRLSVPFVCSDYGKDGCSRGDSCQKLHLCRGYIMNKQSHCKAMDANNCDLCHNLDSRHTRDILERYGLANLEERQILGAVLVPVDGSKCLKKRPLVPLTEDGKDHKLQKGHTQPRSAILAKPKGIQIREKFDKHQTRNNSDVATIRESEPIIEADWGSDTDVTICIDNLLGKCDKGVSCHSEHFTLPYQWTLEDQRSLDPSTSECFYCSKSRYIFSEDVNAFIEKAFCDVDQTEVNITQRYGSFIWGLKNADDLSINFNDMSVENTFWDGSDRIREKIGLVSRLSTQSYHMLDKCEKCISSNIAYFTRPYQWILEYQRVPLAMTSEFYRCSESKYIFPQVFNAVIENAFCDVNQTEVSITYRYGSVIRGLENTDALSINFDDMSVENIHRDGSDEIRENIGRIYRLSTPSYNLADLHDSSECSLATRWRWFFKDSEGVWKPYGLSIGGLAMGDMLEMTYLSKIRTCSFMNGDFHYTVEFSPSMREINLENNSKREVRRRPVYLSPTSMKDLLTRTQQPSESCSSLPLSWKPMPKEIDFIRYALPPSSQNYKSVEKLFSKTMDPSTFTILSIERIQNPFMWSMYQRQKEHMKTKVSAPDLEWRLFHGTDKDSIAKICKNNFDFRVCGKRGSPTRFGEGSYFACNAGFSDYYSKIDSAGWKYMFLADVLVGRYAEGKSSYKRPPEINHETGELYNSCVNRLSDPTTFVVFDRNQLYPSFLIIYTKKPYMSASGSRSCSETKATELMHRREHSFRETKAMSSAQSKQHKVQCTWIEDTPSNSGQHCGGTSFSATIPSSSSPHNEQSSVVISTFDSSQFNVNVPVPTSIAAIKFNKPNDLQSTVITSLPNIPSHIERTRQATSEAYGAQQGVSTATVTSSSGFTSSNMLNRGTATAKWSPSLTSSNSLSVSTTTATSSNSLISSSMLSVSTATATLSHSLTSGNELSWSTSTATSSPSLITSNMLSVSTATTTLSPSLISSNMLIMSTATAMSSPSLISSNMLSVSTATAMSSPSMISSNMLSVSTARATSSPSLISSNMLSVSTAKATSSPSLISSNMLSVSTATAMSSPSLISSNMLSVSTAKATSSPSMISSNMLSVSTPRATSSPSLISSNMLSVSTAKATSSPSLISSNMLSVSTATAMSSPSLTSSNMLSVSTATAMSSPCLTSSDMQPNLSFSSSKNAPKPHSSMTQTPSCNKTFLSPSSRKQHYVQSTAAPSPSYRTPSFLMMSSKSHFCPDAPDIVDLIAYFRQPANSLPRSEHPSGLKTDTRQQTKCFVM